MIHVIDIVDYFHYVIDEFRNPGKDEDEFILVEMEPECVILQGEIPLPDKVTGMKVGGRKRYDTVPNLLLGKQKAKA